MPAFPLPAALASSHNPHLKTTLKKHSCFEDWSLVSAWMFVQRFPTPQTLKQADKRQWEKFLHARHLWRTESGPRRLELFAHATDFCGSAATTNAKSLLYHFSLI